jgi:Tfp pilus assembly protein PilW
MNMPMPCTAGQTEQCRGSRVGFTIAEFLVYIIIAGLVLGSVVRVMTGQGRGYARQIATTDVDETARDVANVLAWELRHATMAADIVLSLASDSLVVRSVQGVGVMCGKHSTLPRYAIWKNGGSIESTVKDSAAIYSFTSSTWRLERISAVGTPSDMAVPNCHWTGTSNRAPDLVIELAAALPSDISVGAPVRAFKTVTYKAYRDPAVTGPWWVGRRAGGSGAFEKLTGPLADNGLEFSYQTATGATATTPATVGSVRFTVRTKSYRPYRDRSGAVAYRYDSLTTRVALRK